MLKKHSFSFILACFPLLLFSENENGIVGSRAKGMGDVATAISDFWSVYNNQAAMPFYGKTAAGTYYDNRYLLKETSTAVLGFTFPLKNGSDVFGTSLYHYGGGSYGKMKVGLAYAKSFASVFSFGLQFDYLLDYFKEATYGKRSGFTFETSIYGQVTKNFSLGFHVYNPARLKMVTYNNITEYISTILRLGMGYTFPQKCTIGFDIEKNLDTKMHYHAGVEYIVHQYLILRGGLRFPDFSFSLGFGTQYKGLSIDFASSYHSYLGYSPQLGLVYAIKIKK
jgi:hypothetical protein